MKLQDLVGRVRKTLGEVEPSGYGTQQDGDGSWDNSQIIGYLNEALGILAHDWRKEASTTLPFTSVGQTDTVLPADCLEDGLRKALYVTNGNSYPMEYLDFERFIKSTILPVTQPTGFPYDLRTYSVWGGFVKMYPGAAATSDSIMMYYYRVPVTLVAAADVPEIPSRFHIAIVYYALQECQNAVEEVNLEFDAGQKWIEMRDEFRAQMSRNQRDKGIRVRGRS